MPLQNSLHYHLRQRNQLHQQASSQLLRKYNIVHQFSSTYYPCNGQAEISNRTILDNLCKSLDKAKGKWAKKLPGVLRVYRTTKCVSTGEAPFSLAYGTKTIILVDISMPTLWVEGVVLDQNDTLLCLMLDHSEERRQQAQIHITAYPQ